MRSISRLFASAGPATGNGRSQGRATALQAYRCVLFSHGADSLGGRLVETVLRRGGMLFPHEVLRCRIRYLTDGLALGSSEFIKRVFTGGAGKKMRVRRREGARPVRQPGLEFLYTLRDLRGHGVGVAREQSSDPPR
jgi:hypothetical protein